MTTEQDKKWEEIFSVLDYTFVREIIKDALYLIPANNRYELSGCNGNYTFNIDLTYGKCTNYPIIKRTIIQENGFYQVQSDIIYQNGDSKILKSNDFLKNPYILCHLVACNFYILNKDNPMKSLFVFEEKRSIISNTVENLSGNNGLQIKHMEGSFTSYLYGGRYGNPGSGYPIRPAVEYGKNLLNMLYISKPSLEKVSGSSILEDLTSKYQKSCEEYSANKDEEIIIKQKEIYELDMAIKQRIKDLDFLTNQVKDKLKIIKDSL